jgi:hypothetical protein
MKSLIGLGSMVLLLTAVTAGCKDDLTVGSDDGGGASDGGASDGGSGGKTSCASDSDCTSGDVCAYAESATCDAKGVCVAKPAGAVCGAIAYACACDGTNVEIGCNGLPDGFVSKPFAHDGACAIDGGQAGPSCSTSADCAANEVCGYAVTDGCSAKGQCVAEPGATPCVESEGCACDGTTITVGGCGAGALPSGYTSKPLAHENACTDGGGDGGTCVDVNPASYVTSCSSDSDCTLVRTGNICDGQCSCGDTPINQSGLSKYQAATSGLTLEACPCVFPGTVSCVASECTLCTGQAGQPAGCPSTSVDGG